MIRTAAIDAGNDGLKAIFEGLSTNPLLIPNVVTAMEERSMIDDSNAPLEELHVRITSGALKQSGAYAVGNLAAKSSENEHISPKQFKSDNDQTLILMLTALAYDAVKKSSKEVVDVKYVLSTGLPVDEAKIEGKRKEFREKLMESIHEVKFEKTPKYSGRRVRITFEDVFVNVEGYAAMINLTMDDNLKPKNMDLMKQTLLINDMGGNTTDKAVIRNGKIDNEYSTGILLGIGTYLDEIIDEVHRTYRTNMFKSRRQLVDNITAAEDPYIIRPNRNPESIEAIVEKHLRKFARKQYQEIAKAWDQIGEVRAIYNVGGSAALIKDYLIEENEKNRQFEMHFLDQDESILSIVKAYFKLLIIQADKKGIEINAAVPTA
jgi:plasmid segregation protein ParM